MKPWLLTPQAESSLKDIALWTVKQFGEKQAIKYRDELIACIKLLAGDNPPHAKSCENLVTGKNQNLFYYQQGSHYIIFRETSKQLEILEFFHQKMDLPAHIKNLI